MDVREVERRHKAASARRDATVAGSSLVWSFSKGGVRAHIPSGAERIIDVAAVFELQRVDGLHPLVLQVASPPYDGRHEVTSLVTELDLAVTARNTNTISYCIRIRYDGKWDDAGEDVWEHLKVESVKRLD
ncbi:MAG TPA: hypothetical protein VL989_02205 [Candidatus Sulfotelmatobacter sp.]|nr:hypothetical protein [Candidatus Sulfotelmatobacter sp.]